MKITSHSDCWPKFRQTQPRFTRLSVESLEDRSLLAIVASPIAAVHPVDRPDSEAVEFSGLAYFSASDGSGGAELWKSDGTAAGTALVKEMNPGLFGSYPENLVNVNGSLFFSAFSPGQGRALWKTDGTTAGTVVVRDSFAGGSADQVSRLTNFNGTLYFTVRGTASTGLWKSDGTSGGTVLVKNVPIGESSYPGKLTSLGGKLYFSATDASGVELWTSDGTTQGTVLLKDLAPGSISSYPRYLTNANGTLFFATAIDTFELWKSDGTPGGTTMVSIIPQPSALTSTDGTAFFTAAFTGDLWKSNGTSAGTSIVLGGVSSLNKIDGDVFVFGGGGLYQVSAAGAVTLLTVASGGISSLVRFGSLFVFMSSDSQRGHELWASDGTQLGTALIADLLPGNGGSLPRYLSNVNGKLFFSADDGTHGRILWSAASSQANQAPFFAIVNEPNVTYAMGPQSILVASGMSAGIGEASQQLDFIVTNNNHGLFSTQPTIDRDGKLAFVPILGVAGTATITVSLHDDGGTANGGADTSPPQTFPITIRAPVRYHLAKPLDVSGDDKVVARDALLIINCINQYGAGPALRPGFPTDPPYYFDTSGDDMIVAGDALAVINYLNEFGPDVGEGEARQTAAGTSADVAAGSDLFPGALNWLMWDELVSRRRTASLA